MSDISNASGLTKREQALVDLDEHASLAPLYATVNPSSDTARFAVCSYLDRQRTPHVDVFLFDTEVSREAQMAQVMAMCGGALFRDMKFLYWLGKQD